MGAFVQISNLIILSTKLCLSGFFVKPNKFFLKIKNKPTNGKILKIHFKLETIIKTKLYFLQAAFLYAKNYNMLKAEKNQYIFNEQRNIKCK